MAADVKWKHREGKKISLKWIDLVTWGKKIKKNSSEKKTT